MDEDYENENEMEIEENSNADETIPNVETIDLPYKQNFENAVESSGIELSQENGVNGVSKVTIKFGREEDMVLICLSAFVHDYIHDYNLGAMHSRVINKNTELFKSLNIKMGLQYFKTFVYSLGGGVRPGDFGLYNDLQYTDIYKDQKKEGYNFNFDNNEISNLNNFTGGELEQTISEIGPFNLKQEIMKNPIPIETKDFTSPKTNEFTLIKPLINGLTEETLNTLYKKYENDADMIALHSSLNTYIVTYLGCRIRNKSPLFLNIINNTTNKKNGNELIDILNALDYLIYSFLIGSADDSIMLGYSELFILLKCALCYVIDKKNNNLQTDIFSLLVSSDVIEQFIINYIAYLFCNSVDEIVSYFPQVEEKMQQMGGMENGVDGEEIEIEVRPKKRQKKLPVPVPVYQEPTEEAEYMYISEPVEGYWSPGDKIYYNVAEYVFIMHNNLLTTLSRGMFVKLGIWQKIFGENYVFGNEQMNQITLEKLKQIYPFETNKNNELLCLQILILKRTLLEMNPVYTLTFGAKVDDDLKDYLDSFFNEYYINKNNQSEVMPSLMDDV